MANANFVRENGGLYALLDVLGRRQEATERSMDRSLQRQQVMASLEEMRANARVNMKAMELEKLKLESSMGLQAAQIKLSMMEAETGMLQARMGAEAQKQQLQIAWAGERRLLAESKARIQEMLSNEARSNLNLLSTVGDKAMERMKTLDEEALKAGNNVTAAKNSIIQMFGVVTVEGTGEAAMSKFTPHDRYKRLMESYAKAHGLKEDDYQSVAFDWANKIGTRYALLAEKRLMDVNAERKGAGQEPLPGIEALSVTQQHDLVGMAVGDVFTNSNGVVAQAVRGKMGDKAYQAFQKQHADDPNSLAALMQSAFRYDGKQAYIGDINPDVVEQTGNAKLDYFMKSFYSTMLPSMYQSVPSLASNQNVVLNVEATRADLRRTMKTADHLLGVGMAKVISGDLTAFDKPAVQRTFEEFSGIFGNIDTSKYREKNPYASQDELENARDIELMKDKNYGLNVLIESIYGGVGNLVENASGGMVKLKPLVLGDGRVVQSPVLAPEGAKEYYGLPRALMGQYGEKVAALRNLASGDAQAVPSWMYAPAAGLSAATDWVTGRPPQDFQPVYPTGNDVMRAAASQYTTPGNRWR